MFLKQERPKMDDFYFSTPAPPPTTLEVLGCFNVFKALLQLFITDFNLPSKSEDCVSFRAFFRPLIIKNRYINLFFRP